MKSRPHYTFQQFEDAFPNDDACLESIKERRWPDGRATCIKCKAVRKHYRVKGRTAYACHACGTHIYPLAGTIFHKSTTSLKTWFFAMRLITTTRSGVSAKHLQRETGVTYKTAWRMMKQIRLLMAEGELVLQGSVEMDETYIGGKAKNKHLGKRGGWGRNNTTKTPVFGMVERKGRVVPCVTVNAKVATIFPLIAKHVRPQSIVYTDQYTTYDHLKRMPQKYTHYSINHANHKYVDGHIHTNTIEGFWSTLKRGIVGVYRYVSTKHLQSYCNEFAFRYNRRHSVIPMFTLLLERASMQVRPSACAPQPLLAA